MEKYKFIVSLNFVLINDVKYDVNSHNIISTRNSMA